MELRTSPGKSWNPFGAMLERDDRWGASLRFRRDGKLMIGSKSKLKSSTVASLALSHCTTITDACDCW